MNITINSNDTYFHIDTYGTFTLDYEIDKEVEYYREEQNKDVDSDSFSIDYVGYRKELAVASIDYIKTLTSDGGIITDITFMDSSSPRFYNYTTDSYTALWTYNKNKLKKYINNNYSRWMDFTINQWPSVSSNVNYNTKKWINNSTYDPKTCSMIPGEHTSIYDNEDCITSMIDFYTRDLYQDQHNGTCGGYINDENYIYYIIENVSGLEYIELDQ